MYDPSGSLYGQPKPPGSHPDPLDERGLGRHHSSGREKRRWGKSQWKTFFVTIVLYFLWRNGEGITLFLTELWTENQNAPHRIEQQIADLDQAVLRKPEDAQAWFHRGGAKYELGQ